MSGELAKSQQWLRSHMWSRRLLKASQRTRLVGLHRSVCQSGCDLIHNSEERVQLRSGSDTDLQSCFVHLCLMLACVSLQIDWGDFGTGTDTQGVTTGITLEEGIDWGVGPEVGHLKQFVNVMTTT